MKDATLLASQELFSHFEPEQIELLAQCVSPVRIPAGTVMVRTDEQGREPYLLVNGQARVFRETSYGTCMLALLEAGDLFGEASFLDGRPRSSNVELLTESDVLTLDPASLEAAMEESSRFQISLYWTFWRSLSNKLRASNQALLGFFDEPPARPAEEADPGPVTMTGEFQIGLEQKRQLFQEQRLSSLEINFLASLSKEKKLPSGELIFKEGEPADRMYVVLDGKVRISKQIPGAGEEALAILGRGDYFGEMALIDSLPRSADARAHTGGAVILIIPRDVITGILHPKKLSSARLLKILCGLLTLRLRAIDDKIASWHVLSGAHPPLS